MTICHQCERTDRCDEKRLRFMYIVSFYATENYYQGGNSRLQPRGVKWSHGVMESAVSPLEKLDLSAMRIGRMIPFSGIFSFFEVFFFAFFDEFSVFRA